MPRAQRPSEDLVEAAQRHVGEPTSGDVPGGDDLTPGEAQPELGIDQRHPLVVGGKAAPEVHGEDRLLNEYESHGLQWREDPEDARRDRARACSARSPPSMAAARLR